MFFKRVGQSKRRSGLFSWRFRWLFHRSSCRPACRRRKIDLSTYVDQTEPADVLYNQGLANLNAGRLQEASRKFDARRPPASLFGIRRKSMVMGAFADYRQGNYDDAIGSAKRYLTLYPGDR